MKKLLIALTAVASFAYVAKATDSGFISGTSFEAYPVGAFDATKDDAGDTVGTAYWSTEATECGTVTNYEQGVTLPTRPAQYTNESTNARFLMVDTDKPLYRNINESAAAEAIPAGGLYVDTLVQFTATEQAPTPDAADKLIVWLQAIDAVEAQGTEGHEGYVPPVEGSTNLVVTAGVLDANYTPTASNYVISSSVSVEPNTWHRLTIKSKVVEKVEGVDVTEFQVYVDGTAVQTGGATPISVFPSLIKYNDTDHAPTNLTALAVQGTGAIDDISFTTVDPFPEAVVETFNFTCTINDTANEGDAAAVAWTYAVDGGTAAALSSGVAVAVPVGSSAVVVTATIPDGFKLVGGTKGGDAGDDCYYWSISQSVSTAEKGDNVSLTVTVEADAGGETTEITAADVALAQSEVTYVPSMAFPAVTVTVGGTTLTVGTDYTASWNPDTITGAGTYTLTVTGRGNYSGTVTKTLTVTASQQTNPTIGGVEYATGADFVAAATSGTVNVLPSGWTVEGNAIKNANGGTYATFPAYYTVALNGTALTLVLNNAALNTVSVNTQAESPLTVDATTGVTLAVTVTDSKLYYGLASCATVDGTYAAPAREKFVQGGGSISLNAPKSGDARFYKIYITDVLPAQ